MTIGAVFDDTDGVGLADLVRRREVSPTELLDAAIARVEQRNPALNAVVMKLYDYGRRAIAAGLPPGPLHGVPYLMKDLNGAMAGVPTTRGSRFFADVVPTEDSILTRRLKAAGLVIFGKTNTCELGLSVTCEPRLYGPTHNPWDLTRTPGGSSGGSAAAVAARIVPMAHAADGFGSIRVPAACCGLVGLKPTRARNSLAPNLGEAVAGIVAEHAVTVSVRDTAALLDATSGTAQGDPYFAPPHDRPFLAEVGADPGRLRIAVTFGADQSIALDADCANALHQTAKLCSTLGHTVDEAEPGIDNALAWKTFVTLVAANTWVNLRGHPSGKLPQPDDVEKVTWATAEIGAATSAPTYVQATQTAHRMGRQMATFHAKGWDVLLTPALATPPVKLGWLDMMMDDVTEYWRRIAVFTPFTVWFNLTGQPAMVFPVGFTPAGLPLAVQAVAPIGGEAVLFRLAAQIEAAQPWSHRKPKLT